MFSFELPSVSHFSLKDKRKAQLERARAGVAMVKLLEERERQVECDPTYDPDVITEIDRKIEHQRRVVWAKEYDALRHDPKDQFRTKRRQIDIL